MSGNPSGGNSEICETGFTQINPWGDKQQYRKALANDPCMKQPPKIFRTFDEGEFSDFNIGNTVSYDRDRVSIMLHPDLGPYYEYRARWWFKKICVWFGLLLIVLIFAIGYCVLMFAPKA